MAITARNLDTSDSMLPDEVERFLRVLLVGNENVSMSDRANRLLESIGQDLCRAVTNGQWKLPKHILLCMTLRHMYVPQCRTHHTDQQVRTL